MSVTSSDLKTIQLVVFEGNGLFNSTITSFLLWVEVLFAPAQVCTVCFCLRPCTHTYTHKCVCICVWPVWVCLTPFVSIGVCLCCCLSEFLLCCVCVYQCVPHWMCVSWFEMSAFNSHPLWFLFCSAQEEAESANVSLLCRWSEIQVSPQNKADRQTASCCIQTS